MKFIALVTFFVCFTLSAQAKLVSENIAGALIVKSATTKEAVDLFKKHNFEDYSQINSTFPRIYFLRLPSDWKNIPESEDKNKIFIRIMLPLVLKVNEDILAERTKILQLKQIKEWSEADEQYFEQMINKYDVFTRLKGQSRRNVLLKQLLEKVDVIPPSIMIATAGIYSNWGTSRLALTANSLYLQEVWYEQHGLKPLNDEYAQYRYKVYGSLEEGIAERALKINSHINYDYFRIARTFSREMDRPLLGQQVAADLIFDSPQKNIAGMIDYTFSFYKLRNTDYKPKLENVK